MAAGVQANLVPAYPTYLPQDFSPALAHRPFRGRGRPAAAWDLAPGLSLGRAVLCTVQCTVRQNACLQ